MKTVLASLALVVALVAPTAHADWGCNPDPLTWPTVSIPAAPGFAARTITISPQSTDLAVYYGSYSPGLPYAFVAAVRHAEYAYRLATRGYQAHIDGLIDYPQLNDAVWLAATTSTRPGVTSGQTETAQVVLANGQPAAVTVPVYTEARFTPNVWPYGPITVSTPRALKILDRLREIEFAVRHRGWAFPGETGELYASGGNTTVAAHIADYYNGYGYPPELLAAVHDLWLPAPAAGLCQVL